MMTNFDLENEAHKFKLPLIGVFTKDKLPRIPHDGFYVINMQDDYDSQGNDLPGSHWTVFTIEKKKAAYFDSFGMNPPIEVQNFLKPFLPYPFNKQMIQNINSEVCGGYVLSFMVYMHYNRNTIPSVSKRFQGFMSLWSKNVLENGGRLKKYLVDAR